MLFGTRQRLEAVANFYITISGTNVEMVSKFTYLGVTLDEELKWKAHAENVHKKVSKRLGLLRRIRSSLTLQAAQAVYKCIIEPIFSYADTAWGELPESSITSLQRLQNRAVKIVTCQKSTRTAQNIVNSRFARCRHLTTTTRTPFVFSLLFKFVYSQWGLNNNWAN